MKHADLERVAELARLQLGEKELARLARDCRAILDHFETIRRIEIDAAGDGEASPRPAPLRRDRVAPDSLQRPLSTIAPAWCEGYFVLPRLPAMEGQPVPEEGRARPGGGG